MAAWRSFVATLNAFPAPARERGRRYAQEGRVAWIEVFPEGVDAEVVGTETYDVSWEHGPGGWLAACSCPVGAFCKHAYAVAWLVVGGEPASAAAPAPPQRSVAERLRAARDPWERRQAVAAALAGQPGGGFDVYDPAFHPLFDEADPDLFCWRVAQTIATRAGGWLPPDLEPFRDRPDLAERLAARTRGELLGELVGWAGRTRRGADRSLRVVLTLGRRAGGEPVVETQARLTSAKLTDAPRNTFQLQQLRSEVQRNPAVLPPAQTALLMWLVDHGLGGNEPHLAGDPRRAAALSLLLPRIAESRLAAWGDNLDPQLAARGGVAPGDPVRVGVEPVRVEPACGLRDGAAWIELRVVWPDGRSRGLREVVYLPRRDGVAAHASLVLAGGEFSQVVAEPPPHLVARMEAVGGFPLPPEERLAVLKRLAPGFPLLAAALRERTRTHAVRPVVALALDDGDWLQVRAFGCGGPWRPGDPPAGGEAVFEYLPDEGWSAPRLGRAADAEYAPVGAEQGPVPVPEEVPAPEADVEAWIDQPDPDAVAPAVAWVERLRPQTSRRQAVTLAPSQAAQGEAGWWLQLNRRRMEEFAAAWAERPPGVAFYGTAAVRRLLEGGPRVTAKLRIEASGADWFTVSADWQAEGLALTEEDVAALRAASARFVRLSSGWIDRDVAVRHDDAAGLLADLGIETGGGPQRVTLWQLAGAKAESLHAIEALGADRATVRALGELRRRVAAFAGLPAVSTPPGVTATLRPYQQQGLDFLAYTAGLGIGAILADDMGLGKTVQALAWIAHLRAAEPDGGPTLVVCPASVVHNWAREAERFTPGLRVLLLTRGSERHALRRAIAAHDLVVTNYALLRQDAEAWQAARLRAVILDEAQNIKNPDAAVTRVAQALQARHRLALTGTPLENRPLDLWSIMEFVNPGYLGTRAAFSARYDRLDVPAHRRALLAARLRPVLLRRLKRDVAPELPDRIEERFDCELTPGQRKLYLAELRRSRALVERLAGAPGGLKQHRIDVLAALTRLRQICCHPALAGGKTDAPSGKFAALFELLEPLLAEGHKVLVFSQFVECLKLLAAELRVREVPHHQLTGQTTRREAVVRAFTEDTRACVFLVSLKAGGTGLNLTAASYVVLFDPWWNPAVEAQAIDRTHRIGQDRTVIAYRLVARGTIEEKIVDLQARKAALVRDVLGEGGFGRALTREDLGFLLAGGDE